MICDTMNGMLVIIMHVFVNEDSALPKGVNKNRRLPEKISSVMGKRFERIGLSESGVEDNCCIKKIQVSFCKYKLKGLRADKTSPFRIIFRILTFRFKFNTPIIVTYSISEVHSIPTVEQNAPLSFGSHTSPAYARLGAIENPIPNAIRFMLAYSISNDEIKAPLSFGSHTSPAYARLGAIENPIPNAIRFMLAYSISNECWMTEVKREKDDTFIDTMLGKRLSLELIVVCPFIGMICHSSVVKLSINLHIVLTKP
ncbi:hypothetical protein AGLY_012872 [Aphis glycines]|uniref:Uncharacterized protein n=1 Tax=Aphis glycines TaxID=307491 RepID=A0A6G0T8I2_APHGL|nr:hypothetical protein AGLY_012872 [Aphis glycines]